MVKKSFFRQQTVSEIIEGRKVETPERGKSLVDKINTLAPDTALYIEAPILPTRFNDSRKFLKYGNEARVGKNPEMEPREAIAKALREVQPPFGSIVVTSRIDNLTVTRVVLDTCMEGMRLYAYACANAPIDIRWKSASKAAVGEFGADFIVSVPSEEEKTGRHTVRFRNFPLYDADSKKKLWTDLGASCDCDYTTWWVTSRYIRERVYCHHIIAAYYSIAAESLRKGFGTPKWAVPFPIFSEEVVQFWKKMRTQVIKTRGGKRYALNAPERSLLLGDDTAMRGTANALHHKGDRKIAEYDW